MAATPAHGRAWELVTRPDANAAPPIAGVGVAPTGDRIAYGTLSPTDDAVSGATFNGHVAQRGVGGWSGKSVGHPYTVPVASFMLPMFWIGDPSLSTWIWHSYEPFLPGAPNNALYRGTTEGGLELLGETNDPFSPFDVVSISDDSQHVAFTTAKALLPADAARTGGLQLYEYAGSTLRLVGVTTGGALTSTCGVTAGSAAKAPNPVSRDGERIFFTSPPSPCSGAVSRVYVRKSGVTTSEVSRSRCTRVDCNAPSAATFLGATRDGSTAYVATAQQLTNDDVDSSQDLYRYDVASDTITRVSAGAAPADVIATRAHPSDDGTRVYFLATGVLVAGEGVSGSPNLYVADGEGLRFVGTLAAGDEWTTGAADVLDLEQVDTTDDGSRLAFATAAALAPGDTDARDDVYLYDTGDDTLTRISGETGGGNGAFDAAMSLYHDRYAFQLHHGAHALSSDGQRVLFTTTEALLPEDVNATLDVYEWFDGELGLVSSGAGSSNVLYFGASHDGSTVFFATTQALVPADDDGGDLDIYAARVGGGFSPPPPGEPECVGDACALPYGGRAGRVAPESLTQAGNVPGKPLTVRRPTARALARMSASGRLKISVRTPLAGRVSARATARIGGRVKTIARGMVRARKTGKLVVHLPLTRSARSQLASAGVLKVRVVVRHAGVARPAALRFELKRKAS